MGVDAVEARRFTTGLHHFVYEVTLADGRAVVARLTRPSEAAYMRSAVALSSQLRPLGAPLPELLASDVEAEFPWMLLERLPGRDLGDLVGSLDSKCLRAIADKVTATQAIVAGTPSSGRYGFAATPQVAPFVRWPELIEADVERSRGRIASAGFFDLMVVERIDRIRSLLSDELDAIPATPFLHDTTTKNVIVTERGEFSGIVDVDDLCFGDPRFMTALTHVALSAHDLPTDYASYLMQAAGWRDDHLYRLYIATIFLGFMSEHGQRFNDNQPDFTPEDRAKLLALYEDALSVL